MEKEKLQFKVSAALKSIIGKDLITNDIIAVFELVKNSFDAHATEVKIIFKNLYTDKKNSSIVIQDNGKGMDLEDFKKKWLFVAYSAKQDNTEDEDYRKTLGSKKFYAGAKGIGRFSCDRLGGNLNLISIKNKNKSKIENLKVIWDKFEKDQSEEFVNIGVEYQTLAKNDYKIKYGTVLEITQLRDDWNRKKLLDLKHSLEKLINPTQDKGGRKFSISLEVKEEIANDKEERNSREKVNGSVENTVFERLKLKTTQVKTIVSPDGKTITSELTDRGTFIYRVTEQNPYKNLSDVSFILFYLNQKAKVNFSKIMGMSSKDYGSVFLYKNGFRVYPFGEFGEDRLGIDVRKQQGYNRFLGTREIIGRIEIISDGNKFKETSSRDGGLIRTESYDQLVDCFMEKTLKRLERYVVDVQWDIKDEDEAISSRESKDLILSVISKLANVKNIISFEYNKDFLDIVHTKETEGLPQVVKNLTKLADETGNKNLYNEMVKVGKQVEKLQAAKQEAEKEVEQKGEELKEKEDELVREQRSNLFLKKAVSTDTKSIISLQHHIDHGTNRIDALLDKLKDIAKVNFSKEKFLDLIQKISLENKKISTLARFVTKANFDLMSSTIEKDLIQFIREYNDNVYQKYEELIINGNQLKVSTFIEGSSSKFVFRFRPLEMIIIIDNLIDNAQKAGAKKLDIVISPLKKNGLKLVFRDDGSGVPDKNKSKIFDFGFTTTSGSGLGLYHIKQIIEKMNGTIVLNSDYKKGAEFDISLIK